jgi:hypothetical protein
MPSVYFVIVNSAVCDDVLVAAFNWTVVVDLTLDVLTEKVAEV